MPDIRSQSSSSDSEEKSSLSLCEQKSISNGPPWQFRVSSGTHIEHKCHFLMMYKWLDVSWFVPSSFGSISWWSSFGDLNASIANSSCKPFLAFHLLCFQVAVSLKKALVSQLQERWILVRKQTENDVKRTRWKEEKGKWKEGCKGLEKSIWFPPWFLWLWLYSSYRRTCWCASLFS